MNKIFQKIFIDLKNLTPSEKQLWVRIMSSNKPKIYTMEQKQIEQTFLLNLDYNQIKSEQGYQILDYMNKNSLSKYDQQNIHKIIFKIFEVFDKEKQFKMIRDWHQDFHYYNIMFQSLTNNSIYYKEFIENMEQKLFQSFYLKKALVNQRQVLYKMVQNYLDLNLQNDQNCFFPKLIEYSIEFASQEHNLKIVFQLFQKIICSEYPLSNELQILLRDTLLRLFQENEKNDYKIFELKFCNNFLQIYFKLFPSEINNVYHLPFKFHNTGKNNEFYEPIKPYMDKLIQKVKTMEFLNSQNKNLIFFYEEHDTQKFFNIKNPDQQQKIKTRPVSEQRMSNGILQQIKQYPGTRLFDEMQFAGMEFDHIISTNSEKLHLIEIHGFQHYMNSLTHDKLTNKLSSRSTSQFNGKTQMRNNIIKNLGFDSFQTVNWNFFFGKFGLLRENDDLNFIFQKIDLNQFLNFNFQIFSLHNK